RQPDSASRPRPSTRRPTALSSSTSSTARTARPTRRSSWLRSRRSSSGRDGEMLSKLESWQTGAVLLAIVVAGPVLAFVGKVDGATVGAGLFGLANLLLGAGAVSHGVSQGSKASTDPPAGS